VVRLHNPSAGRHPRLSANSKWPVASLLAAAVGRQTEPAWQLADSLTPQPSSNTGNIHQIAEGLRPMIMVGSSGNVRSVKQDASKASLVEVLGTPRLPKVVHRGDVRLGRVQKQWGGQYPNEGDRPFAVAIDGAKRENLPRIRRTRH
jgi:hypothetical protein